MRFALVEAGGTRREPAAEAALERVLTTGERLRIGAGVDAAALRKVLEALRAGSTCRPACGCICV